MSVKEPDKGVVIGNFQLSAQLPNGRNISMSAYLLEGEDADSLNKRLDFCQDAIERQRTRCEIPELEGKREQMVKALGQIKEVLADLEGKRRNGQKLSSQEELNLRNHRMQIGKIDEEIKRGDAAIAEAKKKAGVG